MVELPASPVGRTSSVSVPRALRESSVRRVSVTSHLLNILLQLIFSEILPNFELFFENSPSTETLDYVLLDGFMSDLLEFTICFWMQTEDKDNYGTPFSYATKQEDNEVKFQ